jgi:hypothetical protein
VASVAGRTIRLYDVPSATNDGSAFAGHVVMVWTESGHTYAVGFHNISGERATAKLDFALLRGMRLVGPPTD